MHPVVPLLPSDNTYTDTHTHMLTQGHALVGGALFAALLMFKHLFLSLAPAYFVHLLGHYCCCTSTSTKKTTAATAWSIPLPDSKDGGRLRFLPLRFLALGAAVLAVFAAAFVPFLLVADDDDDGQGGPTQQLLQILQRLFPFGAYTQHVCLWWACNVADARPAT